MSQVWEWNQWVALFASISGSFLGDAQSPCNLAASSLSISQKESEIKSTYRWQLSDKLWWIWLTMSSVSLVVGWLLRGGFQAHLGQLTLEGGVISSLNLCSQWRIAVKRSSAYSLWRPRACTLHHLRLWVQYLLEALPVLAYPLKWLHIPPLISLDPLAPSDILLVDLLLQEKEPMIRIIFFRGRWMQEGGRDVLIDER